MQSKGAIKLFAIVLVIASLYQLSFSFKTRSVEKAAGKKFLFMIVHEFVGMKRNHDKCIFLFTFILRRFKASLFVSPCHDPVPVSIETL